jgi:beta-fructofuranosidase
MSNYLNNQLGYSPPGMFLWDPWFIRHKGKFHMFHLQARRTDNPESRHDDGVSIGHAVSRDLSSWEQRPTALQPGRSGEWDSLSLWTGSVIRKGKKFYMFYTGRNGRQKNIQKIGLATSMDLDSWEKHPENPILEADNLVYEMADDSNLLGKIGAWRDPYVFRDSRSRKYYMIITARKKGKKREYNGCIALAESRNLIDWRVRNPILAKGRYDEMETPQMVFHDGRYYLFFGVPWPKLYHPGWERKTGNRTGLHCYYSKDLFKGYRPVNRDGIAAEDASRIYSMRLIQDKRNTFKAIGWLHMGDEGFIGRLSAPGIVEIKKNKVRIK